MLFHMIYIVYLVFLCLLSSFFRWTLPEMKTSSEKNGQKEFPTPYLAGRADQILPL